MRKGPILVVSLMTGSRKRGRVNLKPRFWFLS